MRFAQDVTIASQDPTRAAVVTDLTISQSSGLTVRDLEFRVDAARGDNPFKIVDSTDVHFNRLNVHGSLDGNSGNDVPAFFIRNSSDVSVENSEFQQLRFGVGHLDSDHLKISGNTFHDIREDGVRGGGSSYVTISRNTFRDFHGIQGDHPDAIQFWTYGTKAAAHDITISENVFLRGNGDGITPQGIFFGDELGLRYQNVTITDNFLAGASYNSIAVFGGTNVTITGNTLTGYKDIEAMIRLENVNGATVQGNSANSYLIAKTVTGATLANNLTIGQVQDGGQALYTVWQATHPLTATPDQGYTPPPATGADQPAPTPVVIDPAQTLKGTGVADQLTGLSGADTLAGMGGADTLVGGAGNDRVDGGSGNDRMEGGAGDDLYFVEDAGDFVFELGNGGYDTVYSYTSHTLGANVEKLQLGGEGGFQAIGNDMNNYILGNGGANRIEGRGGADQINGGGGADTIVGGAGADLIGGGAGNDRFVMGRGDANGDQLQDFAKGDRLEFSGYSAGSTLSKVAGSATDWKIVDAATGAVDVIKLLNGYQLGSGDYLFS